MNFAHFLVPWGFVTSASSGDGLYIPRSTQSDMFLSTPGSIYSTFICHPTNRIAIAACTESLISTSLRYAKA